MQEKDKMKKYMQKNAGSCSGQNNSGQTFIDDKKECYNGFFSKFFFFIKWKVFSSFLSLSLYHCDIGEITIELGL